MLFGVNLARFIITGSVGGESPSADGGYDAVHEEGLAFRLENGPSGRVRTVTYQVHKATSGDSPLATKGAPELVLAGAGSGQSVNAETPGSDVTTAMPADGMHSWVVRCLVNDGVNAQGQPDPNYVFERLVVIRSDAGLRKIVAAEGTQYEPEGWAEAYNELAEAVDAVPSPSDANPAQVVSVTETRTLTIDDWGGANPAKTLLVVLLSGAGNKTVSLPTDDARVAGARVLVVKAATTAFTATVAGTVNIADGSTSVGLNTGLSTTRASALFVSDGNVWLLASNEFRDSIKQAHLASQAVQNANIANSTIQPGKLASQAAGTVLANATGGAASPTATKVNDSVCDFTRGNYSLQVAPSPAVPEAVAATEDAELAVQMADSGVASSDLWRITFIVTVTRWSAGAVTDIWDVSYQVVAYAESDGSGSASVTVVSEASLADPDDVTNAAVIIDAEPYTDGAERGVVLSVTNDHGSSQDITISDSPLIEQIAEAS